MNFAPAAGARGRLGLLAALIALPLSVLPASAEDVVARVNGKDITASELQMATDVFGDQLAQIPEAQRRTMLINALVDMHVMADAALAAGTADSPKYKARMAFLEAQALRNTYVEDEVQGKITEDEIKARYEKDTAGYVAPEEVHARHILVKTEEEANAIIKQLADGGDFEAIAKEKSEDPGSKPTGGDLGFFTKGQMVPEFEAEAFALKPGETSTKPVKTQFGYHILKVEERRAQPVPTLDQVREQVVQVVERDKYQETLAKMREAAKIEILPPAGCPGRSGRRPGDTRSRQLIGLPPRPQVGRSLPTASRQEPKMSGTQSPLAPKSHPELPALEGVRFATAAAGIKYKGRTDVLLVSLDEGTEVAGIFTTSKCPVGTGGLVSRQPSCRQGPGADGQLGQRQRLHRQEGPRDGGGLSRLRLFRPRHSGQ